MGAWGKSSLGTVCQLSHKPPPPVPILQCDQLDEDDQHDEDDLHGQCEQQNKDDEEGYRRSPPTAFCHYPLPNSWDNFSHLMFGRDL